MRIVALLLLPALMSGFLLVFIVGTREFTIPLVLHSPENIVLPVLLWQLFQNGQPMPSAGAGDIHHGHGVSADLPRAPLHRASHGVGITHAQSRKSHQIIRDA